MTLAGLVAAAMMSASDPGSAPQQTTAERIVEAVRYCVDLAEVGADAAVPEGFSPHGPAGWTAGEGPGRVMVVAGAAEGLEPCMVIAAGLEAGRGLPDWFGAEGFSADHGLGYGFYRRTGDGRLIYANWLRPEDSTYDGSPPILLVAVRSLKEPD